MTTPGEQPKADAPAFAFPTADNHDENAQPASAPKVDHPTEEALDHGIEESFPASDPVSVSVTSKLPAAAGDGGTKAPGPSTGVEPTAPGDDAPAGTSGTGEGLCRGCGGTGRTDDGKICPDCEGLGKVTVGVGGG